jgi:hypothetical protein
VKYTSLQSLGSLLGLACLAVACASSDDAVDPPIGPADAGGSMFVVDSGSAPDTSYQTAYDSSIQEQDTSTAADSTMPSSSCNGHCTQNSDCTATCTPPNGDVACCDTATSMCYVASGVCQVSTTNDASMPAPY